MSIFVRQLFMNLKQLIMKKLTRIILTVSILYFVTRIILTFI